MFDKENGSGTTALPDEPTRDVRAEAKLLEPVATVIRGTYRLFLVGLIVSVVGGLLGLPMHLPWGGRSLCAPSRSEYGADGFRDLLGPRRGIEVMVRPAYCTDHASTVQWLFDFLGGFPTYLLIFGCLFLLDRLVRGAVKEGVHTVGTAARLRVVGWWVLIGGLLASWVEATAHDALLSTLAQDYDRPAEFWPGSWEPSLPLVFTALGILTFARIMRAGAAMREDLEGTV